MELRRTRAEWRLVSGHAKRHERNDDGRAWLTPSVVVIQISDGKSFARHRLAAAPAARFHRFLSASHQNNVAT